METLEIKQILIIKHVVGNFTRGSVPLFPKSNSISTRPVSTNQFSQVQVQ